MAASDLGFLRIKVIALAVVDKHRAHRFYSETLGLEPAYEGQQKVGYFLGTTILMLKSGWYATPTDQPNPRITIATVHAPDTAAALAARGVLIADPVQTYDDGFNVGSFLDSEGNKLWFCSPALPGEEVPPA
ncbi:VOC family protein [Zoogloea sp. LCSB751]|uniref:VOC family protein n=1 Tax=Zoogloea sp. LCSB751 TaxID=1965277 RepID=UPI0009A4E476|nr:VOC family protein [Zoogloea sp. LCSB751]